MKLLNLEQMKRNYLNRWFPNKSKIRVYDYMISEMQKINSILSEYSTEILETLKNLPEE